MMLVIRPATCPCCERWTRHVEMLAASLPRSDLTLERLLDLLPLFNRCNLEGKTVPQCEQDGGA